MTRFALPLVALLAVGCGSSASKPAASPAGPPALYNDPDTTPAASAPDGDAAKQEIQKLLAAQIRISGVMAQALRVGAAVWQVSHPGCPTAADLIAAHTVPDAVTKDDAWETPFRVSCEGKSPMVTSAGPDRKFGTPDDIIIGGN
jgi:hypothetical protein